MGGTAVPVSPQQQALLAQQAEQAARFLKPLANRQRLLILCLLKGQERCVSELNRLLPLSQSALSQHLALLRRIALVQTRRQGQTVYYRLRDERVLELLAALCELDGQGTPQGDEPNETR